MESKVRSFLSPENLPPEILDNIDIVDTVLNQTNVSFFAIVQNYLSLTPETIYYVPTIKDLISGIVDVSVRKELDDWCKLCVFTYALPYFFYDMERAFTFRRIGFEHFVSTMSRYGMKPMLNMQGIVERKITHVNIDKQSRFSGFMIRTPPRRYNKHHELIHEYPDSKKGMNETFITGNMHFYVLKRQLEKEFEIEVLFRGTSNTINALPQYGPDLWFTQGLRKPNVDPFEMKYYPEGSTKVPLFLPVYCHLFLDGLPYLLKTLEVLNWEKCKHIRFVGHSMGGALTLFAFYYLFKRHRDVWNKSKFCAIGPPMFMNGAAAKNMERMLVKHGTEGMLTIIINKDDFVNTKYKLGGTKNIRSTVDRGKEELAAWVVDHSLKKQIILDEDTIKMIVKKNSNIALNRFLAGMFKNQFDIIDTDMSHPSLPGFVPDTRANWEDLKFDFKDTFRLILNKRQVTEEVEFVGKMHSSYLNFNISSLWYWMRDFELIFYDDYAADMKETIVVPLCRDCEKKTGSTLAGLIEKETLHPFDVEFWNMVYMDMIKLYRKKKKRKAEPNDFIEDGTEEDKIAIHGKTKDS